MLPYRDSRLTKLAIGVFFIIVLGYAYFEARGILYGPRIQVSSAQTVVHEPFITVQGQADRISSLSMNGKSITVTENGTFNEPYLLAPGLNRIVLDAKDKYGRTRQQVVQIVYVPAATTTPTTGAETSTSVTATSSASTTPVAQ